LKQNRFGLDAGIFEGDDASKGERDQEGGNEGESHHRSSDGDILESQKEEILVANLKTFLLLHWRKVKIS